VHGGYCSPAHKGGTELLRTSFHGVRGSTPCPCPSNRRYGGNTSCVALEAEGFDPIVFDLGTGLRFWGATLSDEPFRGAALVTHMHWDHVQGLPFFVPVLKPGAVLDVYGPPTEEGSLAETFEAFMRPPFFPVRTADLLGDIRFHDVHDCALEVGGAKVTVRSVPHVGVTNGYRVEMGGATVAYISDHQMPLDGSHRVSDNVLELCDGADLVIHDAQYTVEEFPAKATWGHCTVDFAVFVAQEAGAKRLALFHHDPSHGDERLDELLVHAQSLARDGLEVISAQEGLSVCIG
jgi:phosphoribosyl 1,2-cyclic phosphodiesterase